MASEKESHGIDARFIGDVPDYLSCVMCHLVLRSPLQVSKCGHKFCTPCFEKLKIHSNEANVRLLCPVDRDVIDLSTVFEDKGMSMVIGNLMVECSFLEDGCGWSGCLSDMGVHESRCQYKRRKADSHVDDGMKMELRELRLHMDKCEEALMGKDEDIAGLRYTLEETKQRFEIKLTEIEEVNKRYKEELELLQSKDIKQLNLELENLTLRNMILEKKIEDNGSLTSKADSDGLSLPSPSKNDERTEPTQTGLERSVSNNEKIAMLERRLAEQVGEMECCKMALSRFEKESKVKYDLSLFKQGALLSWRHTSNNVELDGYRRESCVWGATISDQLNSRSPTFLCCFKGYPTRLTTQTGEKGRVELLIGWSACGPTKACPTVKLDIDVEILNGFDHSTPKNVYSGKYVGGSGYSPTICTIQESIYKNYLLEDILYFRVSWECQY